MGARPLNILYKYYKVGKILEKYGLNDDVIQIILGYVFPTEFEQCSIF